MATIEQPPAQRAAILRSRSARLADQAATAALYVTHPERFSVREPRARDVDLSALKETGSRPGFSHASAVAALAHAKSKQLEIEQTSAAAPSVPVYPAETPSQEGYQAAICALRGSRSVALSSPTPLDLKRENSTPGRLTDARREITVREKAIRAATGAFYNSRRRSDSAPIETSYSASGARDGFLDLDNALEASRIQHVANANARLFTASPPVARDVEEQKRKSVLQAAAVSMAREMYGIIESTDEGQVSAAIPAAQKGHARAQLQQTTNQAGIGLLQRAMSLQETAQKRAAEKLASMQDETVIYREYYGVEPQNTRPSLPLRKRRASIDSDTSTFDAERSNEIRHQMTSLRWRLDKVDDQRQKDRARLMEAARKNVDAVIQDMEMRAYAETGRPPPSIRKEQEEAALARAQHDMQDIDSRLAYKERVNLGAQTYVEMSDVEALARSRLQPTFDEINERAEAQRAKDVEQRLDEEEKLRHDAVEREREADTRAEEKRQREAVKHEMKVKEERSWPWKRKSKRSQGNDQPSVKHETAADQTWLTAGTAAEVTQQETVQTDTVMGDNEAFASGAAAESTRNESTSRSESKLKTWISKLGSRRTSAAAAAEAPVKAPVEASAEAFAAFTETAEAPAEISGEVERVPSEAEEVRPTSKDDARAAPLRSHPVTANDLTGTQGETVDQTQPEERRTGDAREVEQGSEAIGDKRSRLKSRFSKIMSMGSQESKTSGVIPHDNESQRVEHTAADELHHVQSLERDELRESAAEQGLPAPPAIGKRLSNGTGRESRFSEDL
ncbi:hypothetical protein EYZ11_012370 [Aspergillus tanneri]|uniref:Eisosome protein 1 n=1 Tax=Aspergillus tanneri TaxID=1220188 RepID=A0A4S3J0E8_9EURO|nr:uncharacterized protein ATNIH1004_009063 [Aspergillus tanneri]KAA8644854.1 hypothetical protein ATNIH1004_009063 [Aspergillus tanneri]THC88189.1 hypothetical protein EYZ11_012370 [Aspergillus tanneri]